MIMEASNDDVDVAAAQQKAPFSVKPSPTLPSKKKKQITASSTSATADTSTSAASATSAAAVTSRYRQFCRFLLDLLLFYTTAFFVLLAIISLFALVFLVPFFIDPAWSTLQADFDPNGTLCTTLSGKYLEGICNLGAKNQCCQFDKKYV